MSDVLDIIHRLTFQVDNSQLQAAVATLRQNTSEIGLLQASISKLEKELQGLSKTDYAENQIRKQIIATIDQQKQKIDQLSKSIATYAVDNEAALRKELGIINVLILKQQEILKARNAANNVDDLIKYNQQLVITQNEITKLSGLQDRPIDYSNVKEGLIGASQRRIQSLQEALPFANTETEIKDINKELTILTANLARLQSLGQKQGLNSFNDSLEKSQKRSGSASLALLNLGRIVQDAPFGFIGIANNLNPALESLQRLKVESDEAGISLKQGLLTALTGPAGIGIALSVVSSLLTVYALNSYGASKSTEDFAKEAQSATDALQKEFDILEKITDEATLFSSKQTDLTKRQIDAIKAKGVVNGEQAASDKAIFEAEQTARNQELDDLNKQAGIYKKIQANIKDLKISSAKDRVDILTELGFTNEQQKEVLKQLDKGVDLFSLYSKKLTEIQESGKDKKAEIDDASAEFTSKLQETEYSKSVDLSERIRDLQQKQNSLRLEGFTETSQKIQAQIELERDGLLKSLDKEIEDTRKAGVLTASVQAQYARIRQIIKDNADIDLGNKNEEFYRKLTQQEQDYVLSIKKISLSDRQDKLRVLQETEQDTLFQRLRIAKESTAIELAENSKAYDVAVGEKERELKQLDLLAEQGDEDARTRAVTLRKELEDTTKAYSDRETQTTENGLRNTVKAYEDSYKDRLELIQKYGTYERNAIEDTTNDIIDYYLDQYQKDKISYGKYQDEKRKAQYDSDTAQLQQQLATYKKELDAAEEQERILSNKSGITDSDKSAAGNRTAAARNNVSKASQALGERANAPSRREAIAFGDTAFTPNIEERRRSEISKSIEAYQQLAEAAVQAADQILEAQIKALDGEIAVREKRVDYAITIAARGNTTLLNIEQKRLEDTQKQREKAARKEQGINAVLVLSNSILAVAKAAGETGVGAVVAVPAVIAALIAGIAAVSSISQGFKEGVVDLPGPGTSKSDSIRARLSKGESVITAEATQRYAPLLKAMNANQPLPIGNAYTAALNTSGQFATKREFQELGDKMDVMTEAIYDSKFSQDVSFDARGIAISTQRAIRRDRNRFL